MIVGSSPRVRGKPSRRSMLVWVRGLIPACAGKTSHRANGYLQPWAHPRVCGENDVNTTTAAFHAGSSPRVRGKPGQFLIEGGF